MLAYLDPASGSMVLSVIAGGLAGIIVFLKTFGRRIWSTLAFWKTDEDGGGAEDDAPDQPSSASDEDQSPARTAP